MKQGDRVGFVSSNTPVFFEVATACSHLDAVLVGMNWRLSALEVAQIAADAGMRVAITEPAKAPLLGPAAASGLTVLPLGEQWDAQVDSASPAAFEDRSTGASVLLQLYSWSRTCLLYTSDAADE